jgi:hypothetical protein
MANKAEETTKLETLLRHSAKLWNAADYNKLAEVFDADIIMKKLDDPGSVSGIGNVVAYLNFSQKSKKPQFTIEHLDPPYLWDSGTLAHLSGTAVYQDRTQTPAHTVPPVSVAFTFTFCREDESHDWLMVNAFQAPRVK